MILGARRQERSGDVQAASAVDEERAHGVREIVRHHLGRVLQVAEVAEDPLEVGEAREQFRRAFDWPEARGADEAGGARTHALDRLLTEAGFFDVYAWCQILGHRSSSTASPR
jgi:hypothetical protein